MEELAKEIIQYALRFHVDDVHLLPQLMNYAFYIRDGTGLKAFKSIESEQAERFISYMKFQANMDVGERRRPQTGACTFQVGNDEIELRLSTMTNFKMQETLVIRLLHISQASKNQSMTYFPADLRKIAQFLRYKSGLLLFSGPVSSGKTSTIYHLLRELVAEMPKQIIAMEDPVEIYEPQFLQCETNKKAGITYELLIKSSLRHHPDIMVIGEIRDEETARMVIRGALTGHLMIASIHARDCKGVLSRMMELGVSASLLEQTLIAVMSQQLIPRKCELCQGTCCLHCNHLSLEEKKATLFDMIAGKEITQYVTQNKEVSIHPFNRKLRKAYGLGYITKQNYEAYQLF